MAKIQISLLYKKKTQNCSSLTNKVLANVMSIYLVINMTRWKIVAASGNSSLAIVLLPVNYQ